MYEASVFTCVGYGKMKHLGYVKGKSMTAIKQLASKLTNSYFSTYDKMEIVRTEGNTEYHSTMTRFNSKCPNNTITRGKWG